MSIDWITVAAQIANFLVLVWLLKRFLYRPILDGIDARETEITARMQEAALAKDEAARTKAEYQGRLEKLAAEREEAVAAARQAAEAERDALLAEARSRIDQEHRSLRTHLEEETSRFTAQMHGAGAEALLALTRKALEDLADETLEARMAHHLARKIKTLAGDLRRARGQAAEAVVTSREDLPPDARDAIAAELKAVFPDVDAAFKTDAAQAPGLVLRMGGGQVAWTVDSYIDGLEALIQDKLAPGQKVKAQPHDQ